MKNRLTGVLALAVLLIMGLIVPAGANGTDHCPDHDIMPKAEVPTGWDFELDGAYSEDLIVKDQHDDDVTVTVTIDGDTVSFSGAFAAVDGYCLKSATDIFTDTPTTGDKDISYVVVYSVTVRDQPPDQPLKPILECVSEDTAYFGYLNENDVTVHVPLGDGNKVTGVGEITQGQPTEFLPGRTGYVDDDGDFVPDNAAFSVPYSGSDIVWTLTGPDGMTRTATAGANSPVCPEPPVVEPLDGVQGTFLCSAPEAGSFELYVGGDVGFVSAQMDAGDYALRFTNTDDVDVKFSAGTTVGADDIVGEWAYLDVSEYTFVMVSDPFAGGSTNTVTAANGTDEVPVNRGTFSTNETQICEATPVDDTSTITLVKEWFDVGGVLLDEAPTGINWSIALYTGMDETQAWLPGEVAGDTQAELEVGARYGVMEDIAGDGWEVVDCDALDLAETGIVYDQQGLAGTDEGAFIVPETDSVHLVCNQQVEPGPETLPITILKDWTGDTDDVAFDAADLTITFTIDGDTYVPGDTLDAVVTVDGDDVILPPQPTSFEESVVGLDDVCAWALVDYELSYSEADEAWVVLVTNLVACGEDTTTIIPGDTIIIPGETVVIEVPGETIVEEEIVEVEEPVEVLPEVIEAEPEPEVVEEDEPEPVVEEAEEEAEVRGVTATRAVPTGIDSGTGGYLPSSTPTAALLLLLFGGLALTGGAAASLVRRDG